jgi:hypothetical protein
VRGEAEFTLLERMLHSQSFKSHKGSFMRDSRLGVVMGVSLALAVVPGCSSEPRTLDVRAAVTGPVRHGLWVENISDWLGTKSQEDAFVSYALTNHVNNVYLQVGGILPDTSGALANLLERLYNNGVKADALLDGRHYTDIDGSLAKVLTFNGPTRNARNFQGVHLDLEPWLDPDSATTWIDDLIGDYHIVATEIADHDLPLIGDTNGLKMVDGATAQQAQDMVNSVTRLTLMLYGVNEASVEQNYEDFSSMVTVSTDRGLLVGIRKTDFSAPFTVGADLDAAYFGSATHPGYCGWALYQY